MEKTCDYNICTGCGACSTVCPKNCISFIKGKMGHLFPKIDVASCIDCKKCERVCPALKTNDKNIPTKAYAAFTKDYNQYISSTSGGASHCLAEIIIRNGGVVYGCSCLPGVNIEHIRIDNINHLYKIKGSKYVQSKAWSIYKPLKDDIKKGIPVLFLGTPCQCAAVKALFSSYPENLLLVDLICHGVPSNSFLTEHIHRKKIDLNSVANISFRCNDKFILEVLGYNDRNVLYSSQPLSSSIIDDGYYGPFFYGYNYRASCYSCQFAQPERCSDITIGDFWGLGRMNPKVNLENHDNGVSVILPITAKGHNYVNILHDYMYMDERPVMEAILGNNQLRHPKHKNFKIKVFDILQPLFGIEKAYWILTIPTHLLAKLLRKFHII